MCLWSTLIFTGSSDRTLKAWAMKRYGEWTCIATMRGHEGGISDVCSMGIYVASVASDGRMKILTQKVRILIVLRQWKNTVSNSIIWLYNSHI